MPVDAQVKPRVEFGGVNDTRYIGYKLLSNISFDGEPVTPLILSQGMDSFFNMPVFMVEDLPGRDLGEIIRDREVGLKDKMAILLHVSQQLKAIDDAGYIPFDRSGDNIRVLRYGEAGISTRQLDLEDVYDKTGDVLYSKENAGMSQELLRILREKGINLWARNTTLLSELGMIAATLADNTELQKQFENNRWPYGTKEGATLDQLTRTIENGLGLLTR